MILRAFLCSSKDRINNWVDYNLLFDGKLNSPHCRFELIDSGDEEGSVKIHAIISDAYVVSSSGDRVSVKDIDTIIKFGDEETSLFVFESVGDQ